MKKRATRPVTMKDYAQPYCAKSIISSIVVFWTHVLWRSLRSNNLELIKWSAAMSGPSVLLALGIVSCVVTKTAQADMSDAILKGVLNALSKPPPNPKVQGMPPDGVQINAAIVNDTVRSAVSKAGMPFKESQSDSLHSFAITTQLSDGETYGIEIKARRSISPQIVVECEAGYRNWLKAKCETLSEVRARERIWTSILEKTKQDVPLVGLEVLGGFIENTITEDERMRMKLSPKTNWVCWGYAQIGFKGELDYAQVETNPNLLAERIVAIPKAHEKMVSAINRHVAEHGKAEDI